MSIKIKQCDKGMKREAIVGLAELKPDWDSYGASPVSYECIAHALRVYDKLPWKPDEVFPTPDGTVQLEYGGIVSRGDGLEIEIFPEDSGVLVAKGKHEDWLEKENISDGRVVEIVEGYFGEN